jgi:hypothetical protein
VKYSTPQLTNLGTLSELTLGQNGSCLDGGGHNTGQQDGDDKDKGGHGGGRGHGGK